MKYNDMSTPPREFRRCEKCGAWEPQPRYHAPWSCEEFGDEHRTEHFDVECYRCGFKWFEAFDQ